MTKKICVIGHPSKLGGADTELDHQIKIWQKIGIEVHILHTGDLDQNCLNMKLEERGCIYHKSRDWKSCKGMPVISYCNGEYLKNLNEIKKYASHTIFVNCMTWIFDEETKAIKNNLLDIEIYQREEVAMDHMKKHSEFNNKLKAYVIPPYFDASNFPFIDPMTRGRIKYRMGRIHRADPDKFHKETLSIFEMILSPKYKDVTIMGTNEECMKKIGTPSNWITCLPPAYTSAQDFYKSIDILVHCADPCQTENLPRVGFESMSSGVPLIVDNRGGWKQQVIHGKTGFLANNPKEFAYFASKLAFEDDLYLSMCYEGRKHLENTWGEDSALQVWERFFNEL